MKVNFITMEGLLALENNFVINQLILYLQKLTRSWILFSTKRAWVSRIAEDIRKVILDVDNLP